MATITKRTRRRNKRDKRGDPVLNERGRPVEESYTRYRVEIRRAGHPPESRTFPTLAAARKYADKREGEIEEVVHRAREGKPISKAGVHTLSDAIQLYQEDYPEKAKGDIGRNLKWWDRKLGGYTLAMVTSARINEAKRDLKKRTRGTKQKPIAPATVNRYLMALSGCLSYVMRFDWVIQHPMKHGKVELEKEPEGRTRHLVGDELERLLDAAEESTDWRLKPMILLALSTGMRQGEMLKLEWRDVDLEGLVIVLRGKTTKAGKTRYVKPHGPAADALLDLAERRRKKKVRDISDRDTLFSSPFSGKITFPKAQFLNALQRAGIEDFKWHDLRRSYASQVAKFGTTQQVSRLLGHADVRTTQRYIHFVDKDLEETSKRAVEGWLK